MPRGRVVIGLLLTGLVVGVAVLAVLDAVNGGPTLRRVTTALGLTEPRVEPGLVVRSDGRIELLRGTATLDDVARTLAAQGHDDMLTAADGAWVLREDLHVLADGRLEIRDTTVRLAGAGMESRGGELVVTDADLTGWDDDGPGSGAVDTDFSDGRGWLVARDGGVLRVVNSRLRHLGFDDVGRTGVEWLGPDSRGVLAGSTIEQNHTGVALRDVRGLTIDATVIREPVRDGVLQDGGGRVSYDGIRVARPGRDGFRLTDVRGSGLAGVTVVGAGGDGIGLRGGTAEVEVDDSEVRDSALTGVHMLNTTDVVLRDTYVYGNLTGVVVENSSVGTRLIGNRIAANWREGLFVRDRAERTVVRDNHIDRNGAAGLALVAAGDVEVLANRLAQNADGVRIAEGDTTGRVADNEIVGNIEDGVDLPEQPTLAVEDNLIADNRHGAFSVLRPGRSDPVAGDNTLRDNGDGQERIREA